MRGSGVSAGATHSTWRHDHDILTEAADKDAHRLAIESCVAHDFDEGNGKANGHVLVEDHGLSGTSASGSGGRVWLVVDVIRGERTEFLR